MKLLVVLITFNRLDYTKRTLRGFLDTVDVPYYLVVVDNNSTDGTEEYLRSLERRGRIDKLILNPENYYPGKAANIGWTEGLRDYPDATHLMRLDNDMHLERGWDKEAIETFEAMPSLGQLGLDHEAIENPRAAGHEITIKGKTINRFPGCVGGPCIISRKVWDSGVRYDETPWEGSRSKLQEDSRLSREIENRGFMFGHINEKVAWTFANKSNWKDYPEYYLKTMYDRGYDEQVEYIKTLKGDDNE